MEVRKLRIQPEHEDRLRELLKIYEDQIDQYSEAELDEAERRNSEKIVQLIHKSPTATVVPIKRKAFPIKAGATAFLAAAAAMLFVQINGVPEQSSQVVSKGTFESSSLVCETNLVQGDRTTPEQTAEGYLVAGQQASYLKLKCNKAVFIHIAVADQKNLQLIRQNLTVTDPDQLVQDQQTLVDFTELAATHADLVVIASEERLEKDSLSPDDHQGLWQEEMHLKLQK